MQNRVVITGLGIWSCLGTTLEDVRQSLYDGKSGIIFSQERQDAGLVEEECHDTSLAAGVAVDALRRLIRRDQKE